MKTFSLLGHRDGDILAIVERPWWSELAYWLIEQTTCPECYPWRAITSWSGEWFFGKLWNLNTSLVGWLLNQEKTLYETRIHSQCVAHKAIYDKNYQCWDDDCVVCYPERIGTIEVNGTDS